MKVSDKDLQRAIQSLEQINDDLNAMKKKPPAKSLCDDCGKNKPGLPVLKVKKGELILVSLCYDCLHAPKATARS